MQKQLYMTTNRMSIFCAWLLCGFCATIEPSFADDGRLTVDWKRLNLSAQQSQQIQVLEQDWNAKYMKLQPQIVEHQRKLVHLLNDPKSDSLEIMSTQQTIARLKEQLRNEATANYLRKRALLTEIQQHQLESMMQQMVAEKQRTAAPSAPSDDQGGFMDLIHKVKWAIEPH